MERTSWFDSDDEGDLFRESILSGSIGRVQCEDAPSESDVHRDDSDDSSNEPSNHGGDFREECADGLAGVKFGVFNPDFDFRCLHL